MFGKSEEQLIVVGKNEELNCALSAFRHYTAYSEKEQ
jgi:hypothetical protein